ncbi:signal peptidase II [Candidatus Sumerlaeota bacterium]|nr:signal peptidase II [Candidatus Sumerlaeota bacterium]
MTQKAKWSYIGVAGLTALVLDWSTKLLALKYLLVPGEDMHERSRKIIEIIPGCLNLNYAFNTGGAFSLMENHFVLLTILSTAALGLLFYWIYRTPMESRWLWIAFGLIIGGAIGNLADRFYRHGVVDFIQAYWRNYYWPTFNIADSAICVGMGIVVFLTFFHPEIFEQKAHPPAQTSDKASTGKEPSLKAKPE